MTEIPVTIRNQFLVFLQDYVEENQRYRPMFIGRVPPAPLGVSLDYVKDPITGIERDYIVIDFADGTSLIIPDVYSEFEGAKALSE